MTSDGPLASSTLHRVTEALRRVAGRHRGPCERDMALDSHVARHGELAYVSGTEGQELARINAEVQRRRCTSGPFITALYLRVRDPAAEEMRRVLRNTVKSVELHLRFREIERLEEMHAKFWELLSRDARSYVTATEYEQVMHDFARWSDGRDDITTTSGPGTLPADAIGDHAAPVETVSLRATPQDGCRPTAPADDPLSAPPPPSSREVSPHSASASPHRTRPTGVEGGSTSGCRSPGPGGAILSSSATATVTRGGDASPVGPAATVQSPVSRRSGSRRSENRRCLSRLSERLASPARGGTSVAAETHSAETLRELLFLECVRPPRPTMALFLSCPHLIGVRGAGEEPVVSVSVLYHSFAKLVSLVKCEAELLMWDTNNDGRLSEDEMESYVRDLVPRIVALRSLSDELLPFYCCTVSRRIFWDLDPSNRGVIRIDALLQSAVMEEWVSLQLLTEDCPQNWFSVAVTQNLYEKFLLLDTRNEGTLNSENLCHYKKGLPTVIDDGLPLGVSPLCKLFVDRFFETNVMMPKSELDFRKFVDFVIAVEMLPRCSRPLFFWNILDLDGRGVLTPLHINYFFRETHAKLVSAGLDAPSREVVVQEVFDLIPTATPLCITREEFLRSPQAGLFVALIIDCLSFWTYENRESV